MTWWDWDLILILIVIWCKMIIFAFKILQMFIKFWDFQQRTSNRVYLLIKWILVTVLLKAWKQHLHLFNCFLMIFFRLTRIHRAFGMRSQLRMIKKRWSIILDPVYLWLNKIKVLISKIKLLSMILIRTLRVNHQILNSNNKIKVLK